MCMRSPMALLLSVALCACSPEADSAPNAVTDAAVTDAAASGGMAGAGGNPGLPDAQVGGAFACDEIERRFPGPCEVAEFTADGAPVTTAAYAYDAAERKIREDTFGRDGARRHRTTWAYDDAGQLLDYREYYGDELVVQSLCAHTYEASTGRPLTSVCDGGPGGPDAAPDVVTRYTYDAAARTTTITSDGEPPNEAPDDLPDQVQVLTYDAAGRLLTDDLDSEADGTIDRRFVHTYDARGLDTGWGYDRGADGTLETEQRRTYDAAGRLVDEVDLDRGEITMTRRTTWDTAGRITQVVTTRPGPWEGMVVATETRTYDAEGRPDVFEATWSDGSHSRTTHVYDEAGRLREAATAMRGVFGGDLEGPVGTARERFDCAGNRLEEFFDEGDDGSADWGTLYDYNDACFTRVVEATPAP